MGEDKTRTNSSSNPGNKDYYPQVDELLHASPEHFKTLTNKLNKDWLLCLLKDTVSHLKLARSAASSLDSINSQIAEVKTLITENSVPQPKTTMTDTTTNYSWADAVKKSLDERDYDKKSARTVIFYNVEEEKEPPNSADTGNPVKTDEVAIQQLFTRMNVCDIKTRKLVRLGHKKPDSNVRPRPIELTLDNENEKADVMKNAYRLQGTKIFVKRKLKWKERLKEKGLLKLRYELCQNGFDKSPFRLRDLNLFFNGTRIDEMSTFEDISKHLKQISATANKWLSSTILLLNIRGLCSYSKQAELLDLCNLESIDLIFLTETWLTPDYPDTSTTLFGNFDVVARPDRLNGPHGGVAVLSRKNLPLTSDSSQCDRQFDFGLYFTIRRSNHSVTLFILLYLPPLSSNYSIPTSDVVSFISKAVSSTLTNYPVELFATEIILLGDFNLPFTDWTKMCSTSKREMALLEIFTSMGLFALITDEPTHYQGHTLDNILINNESPNLSHCILDQHTALSDHFPIKITLYVNQIVSTNPNKVIYSFNNAADIQSFENSWETFPFHLDSASEIVDAFHSHIQLSIPLCFPKKRSKRIQQPFYYSSHSMHCLNKMNTLVRICSKNPHANNLAKLKRAREDFVQSVEMDKILFIQGSSTTSLTDCFSLLRKLKGSSYPTIMYLNNSTLQTEIDIANGFNSFFAENFNSTSFSYLPSNSDSSIRLTDLNNSFHPNTLLELLTKVKLSSNQTFDQLPTALLLSCPCLFAELLCLIFHRIIESGNFPNIWKVAIVMPLHKKGSINFIKNYRPISLLPKVSLILERILFTFLYCKTSSKLHPKQFGFQAKKKCHHSTCWLPRMCPQPEMLRYILFNPPWLWKSFRQSSP